MAGYIGTKSVSLSTDAATVSGDITVSGTVDGRDVAADGVTADAALPRSGGTMTGNIAHAGDFTLDVAGDIILDAAGEDIIFKANGATFGQITTSSGDFHILQPTSDKDILFRGLDGATYINALTLDMENAGAATFNSHATIGGELRTTNINTASSTGTLTMYGGASNKGGTIELSGGNNTGSTGSGIVFKTGASTSSPAERMRINKDGNTSLTTNHTTAATNAATMIANTTLGINGNASQGSDIMRVGPMASAGAYFIDVSNGSGTAAYPLLLNPISGGSVGIGTSAPVRQLSLVNSGSAEISLISGTSNQCSILMGDGTSGTDIYRGYIQYDNATDKMLIGTNSASAVEIETSGNVVIKRSNFSSINAIGCYNDTTSAGANLHVNSSGSFIRSTSSIRYKNTVNDATHGLTELMTLRPVTYKGNNDGNTVFGGLIAEEVHDAGLTEFVQYNVDGAPDALAYGNMVSLCIKAIQEQQTLIEALTTRITALEDV